MELRSYPAEALMLIEIAQLLKAQMRAVAMSKTIVESNGITSSKIEEHETYISQQDIVIADLELFDKCSKSEWYLVGKISRALKMCNALWKCPQDIKDNGTATKALKSLILKNVLAKTSVTHFYIVNPLVIRRGKDWKVALTTAQAIHDNNGIDDTLIRDLKPIDKFEFINHNNTQLIGYGYSEDNNE